MGMVTWFKGVVSVVLPASLGQGAEVLEKKAKPRLLDVTDGFYLVEEAKKWGLNFIRRSRGDVQDLRDRLSARRMVKKTIIPQYDLTEIVDEVTERVYEASKEDSHLKRIIG